MLKREFRVRGRMHKNARSLSTTLFTLLYIRNNLSQSRFGFVVSKKVDTRSVVRNKLRRAARSCIEKIIHSITIGFDVQFILKKQAFTVEKQALCNAFANALRKEHLLS